MKIGDKIKVLSEKEGINMIITILGVLLLVVGIIMANIDSDLLGEFGFVGAIIGGFATFICIICILCVQTNKEVDYQNALYEKEVLEYRIENMESDITGNEMLYNDIVKFNNGLRSAKKWANNSWTNWFNNKDIATIDYVEYSK